VKVTVYFQLALSTNQRETFSLDLQCDLKSPNKLSDKNLRLWKNDFHKHLSFPATTHRYPRV